MGIWSVLLCLSQVIGDFHTRIMCAIFILILIFNSVAPIILDFKTYAIVLNYSPPTGNQHTIEI